MFELDDAARCCYDSGCGSGIFEFEAHKWYKMHIYKIQHICTRNATVCEYVWGSKQEHGLKAEYRVNYKRQSQHVLNRFYICSLHVCTVCVIIST